MNLKTLAVPALALCVLGWGGADRARSPEAARAFLREHEADLQRGDPAARTELDHLLGQKDGFASKLYWHTDLAEAEAVAKREGKPILSLRLLGRLDEELSCANSRFFRKTLYPDPRVADFLREHYVLHWQTVRPVPKVTIDFGDGRKVERTITGNSAHYVLDAEGRVLDVLPGLYGPAAFLARLREGQALAASLRGLAPEARGAKLAAWHAERQKATLRAWARDARLPEGSSAEVLAAKTSEAQWRAIGQAHRDDATLSQPSRDLIAAGMPDAWTSGQIATTKAFVENPMLRQLRVIEGNVATDSIRNEYELHAKAHGWFAQGWSPDPKQADARVYRDLFLAPLDDPWYGLQPFGAYDGIGWQG